MTADVGTMAGMPAVMAVECLAVGPLQVNCYLLADPKANEAVIIDPGAEGGRILESAKKRGWKIVAVLLTHGHFDHAGATAEVVRASGAPLLAPRGDEALLADAPAEGARFGLSVPAPAAPTRLVADGDQLKVGGFTLRVLGAPGHTPGGVVYLSPAGLFSGDLLFAGSVGRTDLPGGDTGALLRSLKEKVLTLPDDTRVYPGHGPATTVGRERRSNPYLR
jgi:hydroxyacylglutathione hydrolase